MDVAHEAKSPWNIEIHDILVEKTKKIMADEWELLPALSDDYIRQIVEQKCQSLWSCWRKVQRQHGETDVDAATRWGEEQDRVKKASRQRKRRTTVSCLACFLPRYSYPAPEMGDSAEYGHFDCRDERGHQSCRCPSMGLDAGHAGSFGA